MDLQIISDIHLEFYHPTKGLDYVVNQLGIIGPNIALVGDIGYPTTEIYKDFIKYVSGKCEHVFLIAGNHEYYNSTNDMSEIEKLIQTIADLYDNVYYLQNNSIIIDRIKFIGSTLWTHIEEKYFSVIKHGINGYHASTHADWLKYLTDLADHPNKREYMGKEGRIIIEENYCLSGAVKKFEEVLEFTLKNE